LSNYVKKSHFYITFVEINWILTSDYFHFSLQKNVRYAIIYLSHAGNETALSKDKRMDLPSHSWGDFTLTGEELWNM